MDVCSCLWEQRLSVRGRTGWLTTSLKFYPSVVATWRLIPREILFFSEGKTPSGLEGGLSRMKYVPVEEKTRFPRPLPWVEVRVLSRRRSSEGAHAPQPGAQGGRKEHCGYLSIQTSYADNEYFYHTKSTSESMDLAHIYIIVQHHTKQRTILFIDTV